MGNNIFIFFFKFINYVAFFNFLTCFESYIFNNRVFFNIDFYYLAPLAILLFNP